MPGPEQQRELVPFYKHFKSVEEQFGRERLEKMAERSLHEITRDTHPEASREAELLAKLDEIIVRLRSLQATLDLDGQKFLVDKRGAIWTASKP